MLAVPSLRSAASYLYVRGHLNTLPLKPQSPRKVDAHLGCLLEYLGLAKESVVLLKYCRPLSFVPETENCHLNVWCQAREHGGQPQHGWVLAQDKSKMFSEAIFHTVWRSPDGKLVDVTPRVDSEKRLLFVPDLHRAIELSSYEGLPAINTFDNVRVLGDHFLTPLTEIKVVMQSDFAQRQGLWPW